MLIDPRNHRWFDAMLVVITLGVALAALCGVGTAEYGRHARWAVLAAAMCLSAAAVFVVSRRIVRLRTEAQRFVERLCQLDLREFLSGDPVQSLPKLSAGNPWKPSVERLLDFLHNLADQVGHYEQARSKAEVRCHRLAAERRQMSEILAGLNEPVLAINQFDELVVTNPSAQRLLQIEAPRAERQALGNLVRCEQLVQLLTETRRRQAPTQKTGEVEIEGPDGTRTWYRVTARNLSHSGSGFGAEGATPGGAVAVLNDYSREKDTQQRHAEFVSAVSHEMKTPLAGIKAYVELLVDGDAEDEATREEFLQVINGQADRLQRLIDNLLNLARIEAGVVEVQKAAQALNEVLDEAFCVVQPAAEQKQIEMARELSPMYLGVLIDRDMMLQAAINLLSNAVKYTMPHGRVTLRSRLLGDRAAFEVADTGVGLSAEDCIKVFDKFYRVKSNRQMAGGTGLGLPLARHIVEEVHGGELTVDSTLGVGSTFRVLLPAVEKHD